jgi:hypothetical protein
MLKKNSYDIENNDFDLNHSNCDFTTHSFTVSYIVYFRMAVEHKTC